MIVGACDYYSAAGSVSIIELGQHGVLRLNGGPAVVRSLVYTDDDSIGASLEAF